MKNRLSSARMKYLHLVQITALLFLAGQTHAALPQLKLKSAFPDVKPFRPLWLCEAPDDTKRLFVAQQNGTVFILPKDKASRETNVFLDISDRKPLEKNEEGLLGFAFHPKFKKNGKFYIFYSQQNPRRSIISEFQVSKTDPNKADVSSERILMQFGRPEWNHDGGEILFGPDGYLYIGTGDGGGKNDQFGNSQKPATWLAKILRIDVNSRTGDLPYGIPLDNPFIKNKQFKPEIYAWGLRNPWRFSFDRKTGELYCGDVGQNLWEEVDIIKRGGNYGWNYREGFHPFTNTPPTGVKFEEPIIEYPHLATQTTNHTPGMSITGGYVYRGKKIPSLQGVYLYSDFVSGTLWGLRYEKGKVTESGVLEDVSKGVALLRQPASFGEDRDGEVYVLCYDGRIYELEEVKAAVKN
jgi:quinoprotein glucose dehydrogenase